MVWLFNFTTFVALYLTQMRGLTLPIAGNVISAMGFGGFIGTLLIGSLSDRFGRKPVITVSALLTGVFTLWFGLAGNDPTLLFGILFMAAVFGMGSFPIFLSTTTTEGVPLHLAGLAVGITTAVSEFLGATVMPIIGGRLADIYGLQAPMFLAAAGPLIAMVFCFLYIETAPDVLARRSQKVMANT
jgi:MFS family permease